MAPRFPSFPSAHGKIGNADGTPSPEWVTFIRDLEAYLRAPALESKTVAQLPSASASSGLRYLVTDSNTAVFTAVPGGGGGNVVPVYSDGATWRVG